jgi:hypothetical protein
MLQSGALSSVQLEAVLLAAEAHTRWHNSTQPNLKVRHGFFMGDGAGMGKGRQIAAVITHNWCEGRRKAVWISVSADLKVDAQRDLRDIGAQKIATHDLRSYKLNDRLGPVKEGVLFLTYSKLPPRASVDQVTCVLLSHPAYMTCTTVATY